MRLRVSIPLLVILPAMFIYHSCKDSGTNPPNNASDTTSHKFIWTIDTLGEGNGSVLNDVAIINDTLAYAVGEIYLKDSTGQFEPQPYNIAKWDGKKWGLRRISYELYNFDCTVAGQYYGSTKAVFAFDAFNVIFTDGAAVVRWDGSGYSHLPCSVPARVGAIQKFYGSSANDFYAAGYSGMIARFVNNSWQKIESGTGLDIQDIWGSTEPSGGGLQILAIASNRSDKRLLQIQGSSVSAVPDSGLSNILYGLWFETKKQYYIVGAGIHFKNALDNSVWNRYSSGVVTSYESGGVRGNNSNDVFVTGSFFELVHYNGSTWRNYRDAIPFGDGALGRVAIKRNLVITVGLAAQKAIAVIGKR